MAVSRSLLLAAAEDAGLSAHGLGELADLGDALSAGELSATQHRFCYYCSKGLRRLVRGAHRRHLRHARPRRAHPRTRGALAPRARALRGAPALSGAARGGPCAHVLD